MRLLFGFLIWAALPGAQIIAQQPESSASHVGKAYQLLQDQRYESAAEEFRAALATDPKLVRVRYQLAICEFAMGHRDEARRLFERVATEAPGDAEVSYYLARLDLLENSHDSAIKRLARIAADPPFPDTAFYLGLAYAAKGDSKSALQYLEQAARLAPRDFRVHYRLARVYQDLDRQADAKRELALFSELRQGYQDGASQALTCSEALKAKSMNEARDVCRSLYDPNDPDKLTLLGIIYGQAGAYAEAVEPLTRAAALDPESFEIWHNLGLTYFRLKRYAEARAPLEKAVSLRPDFFGSNALLGAVLYMLQADALAFERLSHAHSLNPEDADTAALLFQVSMILGNKALQTNDYRQALTCFHRAAEVRPADPEVHRRLSAVYHLMGKEEEARRELEQSKKLQGPPG